MTLTPLASLSMLKDVKSRKREGCEMDKKEKGLTRLILVSP
jgi:hypothetical protein